MKYNWHITSLEFQVYNIMIPYLYIFWKSEREVAQFCLTHCTPRTVTCQALLSMGFSRQEYRSGLPFPSPGYLPNLNLGIKPSLPALQTNSLPSEPLENPIFWNDHHKELVYIRHHIVTKTPFFLRWEILRFTLSNFWGKQCNIINITIMLYITSPWLTHCITKNLYLFTPLPHFAYPPSPCSRQRSICFLYSWAHFFSGGGGFLV